MFVRPIIRSRTTRSCSRGRGRTTTPTKVPGSRADSLSISSRGDTQSCHSSQSITSNYSQTSESSEEARNNREYNLVVMGASGVGKTSLIDNLPISEKKSGKPYQTAVLRADSWKERELTDGALTVFIFEAPLPCSSSELKVSKFWIPPIKIHN